MDSVLTPSPFSVFPEGLIDCSTSRTFHDRAASIPLVAIFHDPGASCMYVTLAALLTLNRDLHEQG